MEMISKAMVAALLQQNELSEVNLESQMEATSREAEKEERRYLVTYEGNRKQRRIAASMARKHKQPTV